MQLCHVCMSNGFHFDGHWDARDWAWHKMALGLNWNWDEWDKDGING